MTCYYIVALTKQGNLVDAYVIAKSVSEALDKFIDRLDLRGNISDFRFCVQRDLESNRERNT